MKHGDREIEVKVAVRSLRTAAAELIRAGFKLGTKRVHERNQLYDFPDGRLRYDGCALRIRTIGQTAILTFKGKKQILSGMKMRDEIETEVEDSRAMILILCRLGLEPVFFYEKYRTTYVKPGLVAVLDHTPMGDFVELEGEPAAIDRAARALGFSEKDFIKESYAELFRKSHHTGDMVFCKPAARPPMGTRTHSPRGHLAGPVASGRRPESRQRAGALAR